MNAPDNEIFLRIVLFITSWTAAALAWWAVHLRVAPFALFLYLASTLTFFALYRTFVLWLGFQDIFPAPWWISWVQPMSAVVQFLCIVSVILLTWFRVKEERAKG